MPVVVRGLRELQTALAYSNKQAQKEVRKAMRDVAEPVRGDSETLARSRIPRVTSHWSRMRTGVTRRSVYVAPVARGVRSRSDPRRRPKFAGLLMDRAMEPALERHESDLMSRVEHAMDVVADTFNR